MTDNDAKNDTADDRIEIETLDADTTDVFDEADAEWPPKRDGTRREPPSTTERGESSGGGRSEGDPTPARTHRFAPDAIESMLEDDARIPSLITLTGPRAGESRRLEADRVVLGRHRDEVDLWFGDPGVSRRHAVIERREEDRFAIRDLDSSNGTYINGEYVVESRTLEDGDKIVLSKRAIVKFSMQDPLDEQFQQHMYESSVRDGLTDVYSRAYLDEQLRSDMAFTERHDTQAALMLVDIDHFKRVNDEYGHPVGDGVLIGIARLIDSRLRTEDLIARYGGEEFAILLRNTDRGALQRVAERVRSAVDATTFEVRDAAVDVTVSVGASMYDPEEMEAPQDWIFAADRALYEAKSSGRNCARISDRRTFGRSGSRTPPMH